MYKTKERRVAPRLPSSFAAMPLLWVFSKENQWFIRCWLLPPPDIIIVPIVLSVIGHQFLKLNYL